jgi:hypothetical protein
MKQYRLRIARFILVLVGIGIGLTMLLNCAGPESPPSMIPAPTATSTPTIVTPGAVTKINFQYFLDKFQEIVDLPGILLPEGDARTGSLNGTFQAPIIDEQSRSNGNYGPCSMNFVLNDYAWQGGPDGAYAGSGVATVALIEDQGLSLPPKVEEIYASLGFRFGIGCVVPGASADEYYGYYISIALETAQPASSQTLSPNMRTGNLWAFKTLVTPDGYAIQDSFEYLGQSLNGTLTLNSVGSELGEMTTGSITATMKEAMEFDQTTPSTSWR